MFVATVPNRNSPPAILLREGYRENGKVKTRTLANLSQWPKPRIDALRRCLKGEFDQAMTQSEAVIDRAYGVLFVLKTLADELGVTGALGSDRKGKLALFLVLSRIAHQGSRLSSVRWAKNQAVEEVLGLLGFDEDNLYEALTWLSEQQEAIEERLYRTYLKRRGKSPVLVLYDVTSSYFEGQRNELAAYGYNRDGKRGKKQIVIGLCCDEEGEPLFVRVYRGHTADPATFGPMVELCEKLGIREVVVVGDRGMIKHKGQETLSARQLRFITALTDAQIRGLLKQQVVQLELFEETACEVSWGATKRLVLRKNEATARKEAHRRADKLARLEAQVAKRNAFVAQAKRADVACGQRQLEAWAKRHGIASWAKLTVVEQDVVLTIDEAERAAQSLLDGCYALVTDVSSETMDAATVDARYRDLAYVERDFRALKTEHLEVRPIFLVKKSRTEGHVFVAMLALKIYREMQKRLRAQFGTTDDDPNAITVNDALGSLGRLCFERYKIADQTFLRLPRADSELTKIFDALKISPPRPGNRQAA